jgi:hypothetical protein
LAVSRHVAAATQNVASNDRGPRPAVDHTLRHRFATHRLERRAGGSPAVRRGRRAACPTGPPVARVSLAGPR